MSLVAKPEVNLTPLEGLVYAIAPSKTVDERLNKREEHKEVERARDTCKKIYGD